MTVEGETFVMILLVVEGDGLFVGNVCLVTRGKILPAAGDEALASGGKALLGVEVEVSLGGEVPLLPVEGGSSKGKFSSEAEFGFG